MPEKYKIGVFGSSAGDEMTKAVEQSKAIGKELAKHNCVVITGACSGLPYVAASEAHHNGAEVWGFSPCLDLEAQKQFTPKDDLAIYKKILYTPKSFELSGNDLATKKYRNVLSTATCDAGIVIAGRWGTMNEFTNLFDMGKVIGILTGTGGIADELLALSQKITKASKAKLVFDSSPKELVGQIIKELENR